MITNAQAALSFPKGAVDEDRALAIVSRSLNIFHGDTALLKAMLDELVRNALLTFDGQKYQRAENVKERVDQLNREASKALHTPPPRAADPEPVRSMADRDVVEHQAILRWELDRESDLIRTIRRVVREELANHESNKHNA